MPPLAGAVGGADWGWSGCASPTIRPTHPPVGYFTWVISLPLTMNAVFAMSIIGWSNRLSV